MRRVIADRLGSAGHRRTILSRGGGTGSLESFWRGYKAASSLCRSRLGSVNTGAVRTGVYSLPWRGWSSDLVYKEVVVVPRHIFGCPLLQVDIGVSRPTLRICVVLRFSNFLAVLFVKSDGFCVRSLESGDVYGGDQR